MPKDSQARSCAARTNHRELWAIFVFVFLSGAMSGYAVKTLTLDKSDYQQEQEP